MTYFKFITSDIKVTHVLLSSTIYSLSFIFFNPRSSIYSYKLGLHKPNLSLKVQLTEIPTRQLALD